MSPKQLREHKQENQRRKVELKKLNKRPLGAKPKFGYIEPHVTSVQDGKYTVK